MINLINPYESSLNSFELSINKIEDAAKSEGLRNYRIIASPQGFKIEKIKSLGQFPQSSDTIKNTRNLLNEVSLSIQNKEHHDYKKIFKVVNQYIIDNNLQKLGDLSTEIRSLNEELKGLEEDLNYSQYNQKNDQFEDKYTIDSAVGLSAGANGSVEKIIARDPDGKEIAYAMKTCQPMLIYELGEVYPILGREAFNQGGILDNIRNDIGWTKCTGREKLAMVNYFKNLPKKEIRTIQELEMSYSEEEIKQFRKKIFGSETGGKTRMPDIYLKLLAAFSDLCITDLRDMGSIGESEISYEATIYQKLPADDNLLQMISFGNKTPNRPDEVGGLYLVLEFASGGSLQDYLNKKPLSVEEVLDFGNQLCLGLAALYKNNIIHRDFKLDNVLIGQDGKLKLSDFGTACSSSNIEGTPGNPDATPPECMLSEDQSKYDSWGLGLALIRLLAKKEEQDKVDQLALMLHELKHSYQHAKKLGDKNLIAVEEKRILNFIETGNDGQKNLECGIKTLFSHVEQDPKIKKYIEVIIGLMQPDPQKRLSALDAQTQFQTIR